MKLVNNLWSDIHECSQVIVRGETKAFPSGWEVSGAKLQPRARGFDYYIVGKFPQDVLGFCSASLYTLEQIIIITKIN